MDGNNYLLNADPHYLEIPDQYGIDEEGPFPVIETENNVVIPEFAVIPTPQQMEEIKRAVLDLLFEDNNVGITHYIHIRRILSNPV